MLEGRAGITHLGPYRSSNPRWRGAIENLNRNVDVVAVDYGIVNLIDADALYSLEPRRDNRSVTDPEWVEKGLSAYGCPVHPTSGDISLSPRSTADSEWRCSCVKRGKVRQSIHGRTRSGVPTDRFIRSGHTDPSRVCVGDGGTSLPIDNSDGNGDFGARSIDTVVWKAAVAATYRAAGSKGRRHKPVPLAVVVEKYLHLDTYGGAPCFTRNSESLATTLRLASRILSGNRGFDPYVFGRRVQPGKIGPKTRLVWMAPSPTTVLGKSYSQPIGEALSRRRPFCWGLTNTDKGAIVSELQTRYRYAYCIDWSGFDASISGRIIDAAFMVVKTHLELDDQQDAVYRRYVHDFIHSRIIGPDGNVYQVHRGIPSGSAFTSIIGSVVNIFVLNYIFCRITGHTLKPSQMLVLGDDAVVATNARIDLNRLGAVAAELGLKLSVQKTVVVDALREPRGPYENRVLFLGYYWVCGSPRRPLHEILQRMVYPERHAPRTPEESALRFLSYAATCREAAEFIQETVGMCDVVQNYLVLLRKAGDTAHIRRSDLPGGLRYRVIEGEVSEEDVVKRGLILALTGRLT
jgi:hypothetical protein